VLVPRALSEKSIEQYRNRAWWNHELGTELVIYVHGISLWLTRRIVIIIWCLFSTSKVWKAFSFRGSFTLAPTRGSAPKPHWGLCPQTPFIGSRSALAMAWPLHGRILSGARGLCPPWAKTIWMLSWDEVMCVLSVHTLVSTPLLVEGWAIGHRNSFGKGCAPWVHSTLSQNNFIIFRRQILSQFCTLKIIEIGSC